MAAEVNLYFVAWMNGGLWSSVRRAFEISFAIKNHETYRYGRIDRDTWKTGGVNSEDVASMKISSTIARLFRLGYDGCSLGTPEQISRLSNSALAFHSL